MLSTAPGGNARLFISVGGRNRPPPTPFDGTQTIVSMGQNRLVHKNAPALLLLLLINRDIGEQAGTPVPRFLPRIAPGARDGMRHSWRRCLPGAARRRGKALKAPQQGVGGGHGSWQVSRAAAARPVPGCSSRGICRRWNKLVDDAGITRHLSTGRKDAGVLSLPAVLCEAVVAHSLRDAPSRCQASQKAACPQPGAVLTTTTMYS